jgi:PIN domain nuclease of toxin-antitoxin system
LSTPARQAIADPRAIVFVSAASAWEIATKVRIGKLPGAIEVAERFSSILSDQSFKPLPIGIEHARRAGLMPGEHRDPFDRMRIAQAQIEALCLITNEECFDSFGIKRLW